MFSCEFCETFLEHLFYRMTLVAAKYFKEKIISHCLVICSTCNHPTIFMKIIDGFQQNFLKKDLSYIHFRDSNTPVHVILNKVTNANGTDIINFLLTFFAKRFPS